MLTFPWHGRLYTVSSEAALLWRVWRCCPSTGWQIARALWSRKVTA